jgi:nitric oxide synthase oxygenase domain/subunit
MASFPGRMSPAELRELSESLLSQAAALELKAAAGQADSVPPSLCPNVDNNSITLTNLTNKETLSHPYGPALVSKCPFMITPQTHQVRGQQSSNSNKVQSLNRKLEHLQCRPRTLIQPSPRLASLVAQDQSSKMDKLELPVVLDSEDRPHSQILEEAEKMLLSMEDLEPETRRTRLAEISSELAETGTYSHTTSELEHGSRIAWRLAPRCIMRAVSHTLVLHDCRNCTSPDLMFSALVNHLRVTLKDGIITPTITVFPPKLPKSRGYRVWNAQLLGFAGYVLPDKSILGDPGNVAITQQCILRGWRPPPTLSAFTFLPLLLEAPGHAPTCFELPPDLRHTIHLKHRDYPALASLNLQWHGVPALSSVALDLGGLVYSCAPFNGWFMGTEIARNLLDLQRYNRTVEIADVCGIEKNNTKLWRDHVQLILTQAIMSSFTNAGVSIVDHHTASDSFMNFFEDQIETRGYCPADWVWIVPPNGGSMCKVFHQEMVSWISKPCYREQTAAWVEGAEVGENLRAHAIETCEDRGLDVRFVTQSADSLRDTVHDFEVGALADEFAAELEGHLYILYGSETGTCSAIARKLRSEIGATSDFVTMQTLNDFNPAAAVALHNKVRMGKIKKFSNDITF